MLVVVTHEAGTVADELVVTYCADCTSFVKTADKTDVSPEFEVLLATVFCSVNTEIMATLSAPATSGRMTTTTRSSTRVNPSSTAREARRWFARARAQPRAFERVRLIAPATRALNNCRALTTRLIPLRSVAPIRQIPAKKRVVSSAGLRPGPTPRSPFQIGRLATPLERFLTIAPSTGPPSSG